MPNPHDSAAFLGLLLTSEAVRQNMQTKVPTRQDLEAWGLVSVTNGELEKIQKINTSYKDGALQDAQADTEVECPNWPCPLEAAAAQQA